MYVYMGYAYYKEHGICTVCRTRKTDGFALCDRCSEIRNKRSRERRKEAEEKGLCGSCKKNPTLPGKKTCEKCISYFTDFDKSDREYAKENGFCPECKKNKLIGNEKNCSKCRERKYMYRIKKKKNRTEQQRILDNERMKNIYNERKEQGICTKCGERKPVYGKTMCGVCSGKRLKQFKVMDYRKENNLCVFCGKENFNGYKVCEYHYQIRCEANKKIAEKRRMKNSTD